MSDSHLVSGFKKGVYLFGTTNSHRYAPLQSKELSEIERENRTSRLETFMAFMNRNGQKAFIGSPIGLARTAVGLVALAVALMTAPLFLCRKRSLTAKITGFGLAWTLLGVAEMIPYLGKLAHALAKPKAKKAVELLSEEERKSALKEQLKEQLIAKLSREFAKQRVPDQQEVEMRVVNLLDNSSL